MSSIWHKFLGVVLLSVLVAGSAGAQTLITGQNELIRPKINSPISRLGLGNPIGQYFSALGGMAGVSAAFNDPYHLNLQNPASLSYLQATAFEIGLDGQYTALRDGNTTDSYSTGNLRYMALGFPIKNPINEALDRKSSPWQSGLAFSLTPLTDVGYDIQTVQNPGTQLSATNFLKGNGGTYRLQLGGGIRYKDFAVGLAVGSMFGKITNSRRVVFDSLSSAYTTEFLDDFSVRGLMLNMGVQYTYHFKKTNDKGERVRSGRRLVLGAYGQPGTNFTTRSNSFHQRFQLLPNGAIIRDTFVNEIEISRKGSMPAELALGLSYESNNKFRLGLEYGMGNWSTYTNDAKPESLTDSWHIALGGEYIPNALSFNNYFQKVRYRGGFRYGADPRSVGGEQITAYAASIGFGFPIILPRQQTSFLNVAFEGGKVGVTETLSETYVKMTLGFTLNDNSWFFKRKFN